MGMKWIVLGALMGVFWLLSRRTRLGSRKERLRHDAEIKARTIREESYHNA